MGMGAFSLPYALCPKRRGVDSSHSYKEWDESPFSLRVTKNRAFKLGNPSMELYAVGRRCTLALTSWIKAQSRAIASYYVREVSILQVMTAKYFN